MIRPIQFKRNKQINLNLLKSQLDRRVDVITMMIKGIKQKKSCADLCCSLKDNWCQTQETHNVLQQIHNVSLTNTPSMKSIKSPTILKKSASQKDKQNQLTKSQKTINTKIKQTTNKKILKPIRQSQKEGLRTSRNTNLQSETKKNKPVQIRKTIQNTKFNHQSVKGYQNVKNNPINKNTKKNKKQDFKYDFNPTVVTSFEFNQKNIKAESKKPVAKEQNSAQKSFQNLNFNATSTTDLSDSKYKIQNKIRKGSFHDSSVNNSTSIHKYKPNPSSTLNTSFPQSFVKDQTGNSLNEPNRITISTQIYNKILIQVKQRIQKRRILKQPRINNIRVSLLKRLQDKHSKTQEVIN